MPPTLAGKLCRIAPRRRDVLERHLGVGVDQGTRDEVLDLLVDAVESVEVEYPTRVAIDGPPASGKTTLADELAAALRARGRSVIRASIDDFLRPRAERYRLGEYSAEGCYLDAHDHRALNRVLLDPLGPDGHRSFRCAIHDAASDTGLRQRTTTAPDDAVLIFDGVFLMRPELFDRWDLRVLVSTTSETTVRRAVLREKSTASRDEIERRWRERYIPAQKLYAGVVHPADRADMVVYNDEPERPAWEFGGR